MNGRRCYTQWVYLLVIVAYGWTFVGAYAGYRADAAQHGEAPEVRVWMNGAAELTPSGEQPWTYLGAIAHYVFVYDRGNDHAAILPVNAIARIEPIAAARPRSGLVVAPIP